MNYLLIVYQEYTNLSKAIEVEERAPVEIRTSPEKLNVILVEAIRRPDRYRTSLIDSYPASIGK